MAFREAVLHPETGDPVFVVPTQDQVLVRHPETGDVFMAERVDYEKAEKGHHKALVIQTQGEYDEVLKTATSEREQAAQIRTEADTRAKAIETRADDRVRDVEVRLHAAKSELEGLLDLVEPGDDDGLGDHGSSETTGEAAADSETAHDLEQNPVAQVA